jgi:hypothetical protein
MNLFKLKPLISATCLALVSSVAFSDTLLSTCQYCYKIPKPNPICITGETSPTIVFCGAENWIHQGVVECKQFDNVTIYCANGSTMTYTDERWYGVGTICTPHGTNGDHACH